MKDYDEIFTYMIVAQWISQLTLKEFTLKLIIFFFAFWFCFGRSRWNDCYDIFSVNYRKEIESYLVLIIIYAASLFHWFELWYSDFLIFQSLYPPYPKDRGKLWFYVEAARRPPPAARRPPPAARRPQWC